MTPEDENFSINDEPSEPKHPFDGSIKAIDKVVKVGAFVTAGLGVAYGFFFHNVNALRWPLLICFFITALLGCVWALLIAVRGLSLGMRTRITGGVIWTTFFWGSFGIVGLIFLTIMIRVLWR